MADPSLRRIAQRACAEVAFCQPVNGRKDPIELSERMAVVVAALEQCDELCSALRDLRTRYFVALAAAGWSQARIAEVANISGVAVWKALQGQKAGT